MAIPRTSIRSFLVQAKSALKVAIEKKQLVTLVIGNESCDLDSMSSSLLYAYIRSQSPPKQAFTPLYIPLLHIPAADLSIRPEFTALLPHANLEPGHLITLDDLPRNLQADLPPERTRWILVDHNVLQDRLGSVYRERVGGVIDHHTDEGKIPPDTGVEPRIIEKAASCSSLVANYLRGPWDALSNTSSRSSDVIKPRDDSSNDHRVWDAQVARLAIASVLIDSTALTDESKTTPHDTQAVEYLEEKIKADPTAGGSWDREAFYRRIDEAKRDLESLATGDILRKDYKEWKSGGMTLGTSVVVKPLAFTIDKASSEAESNESNAFDEALKSFAKERSLDLFAIMTAFEDEQGDFQRELVLWAFTDKATEAAKKFEQQSSEELTLEPWGDSISTLDVTEGWRKAWRQRAIQHSRKRVAPLLRDAMM